MATPTFTWGSLSSILHMLYDFFIKHPEAAKTVGRVIEQQTAKGYKLDDEAIITAIMAVIEEHYDAVITGVTDPQEARQAKRKLVEAMGKLQPKEQERLRTVIGTIILPEYYKRFASQTKSDKDAKTGKIKSTTTSWTREAVNQQYTADDLRVKMVCRWAKAIYDGDEAAVILEWKVLGATVHSTLFEAFAQKASQQGENLTSWMNNSAIPGMQSAWDRAMEWIQDPAATTAKKGVETVLAMLVAPKGFSRAVRSGALNLNGKAWDELILDLASAARVDYHARRAEVDRRSRQNPILHELIHSTPGRVAIGLVATIAALISYALATGAL